MRVAALLGALALAACTRDTRDEPPPPPAPVVAPRPVPVPAPTVAVTQLAAGENYTCGLRTDGRVVCWGMARSGQLGDGTAVRRATGVLARGLADATAVAAAADHTCAVRRGGAVACWGENAHGELGDGTRVDRDTPGPVPGLGSAEEIAVGAQHACARRTDGTVWCWGANDQGQLGDGTLIDRLQPVRVPQLADAVALAAGSAFTCALRRGGAVACWGEGMNGQLGPAFGADSPGARGVTAVIGVWDGPHRSGPITEERVVAAHPVAAPVADAKAIAAAGGIACAVRTSGVVTCWGDGLFGQLGAAAKTRVGQADIAEARGAVAVAVGSYGVCARLPDGAVRCWGAALYEPPTGAPAPAGARAIALPAPAISVAIGAHHACAALADGTAACWGDNAVDQLGTGHPRADNLGTIAGARGATQISAGYEHACALGAGHVRCWPNQDPVGRAPPATPVPGIADATFLASGTHHDCAILASREVVCWGSPFTGVLGDGTEDASDRPVKVRGLTDAVEVAAGASHTCARHATGAVSCWGDKSLGVLGTGSAGIAKWRGAVSVGDGHEQLVPAQLPGITDAIALAVGTDHTCIVRRDRTVACWGINDSGQVGDGTRTTRYFAVPVPGLTGVDEITAGNEHVCARTGGTVWCWGDNRSGELGDGTFTTRTRPVAVLELDDATAISAGDSYHTCALRRTGQVVCWGENLAFQLGNDTGPSRARLEDVGGVTDAVAIAAGGIESCALRKTGDVVCWSRFQHDVPGVLAGTLTPVPVSLP